MLPDKFQRNGIYALYLTCFTCLFSSALTALFSIVMLICWLASGTFKNIPLIIKENSITYPIAKEDGSMSQYFKVQGIPAAALIYNDKIVWRGNPARLPEQLLKKYLEIKSQTQ